LHEKFIADLALTTCGHPDLQIAHFSLQSLTTSLLHHLRKSTLTDQATCSTFTEIDTSATELN